MAQESAQTEIQILSDNRQMEDTAPWSDWTRRMVSIASILVVIVGLSVAGAIYGQVVLALAVCLFLFTPIRALMNRMKLRYQTATLIVFSIYIIGLLLLILMLTLPVARLVSDIVQGLDGFLVGFVDYLSTYSPGDAIVNDPLGNPLFNLDFIFVPLSETIQSRDPQEFNNLVPAVMQIVGSAVGVAGSLAGLAYNLFFINVFALLFLLEIPKLYRGMIRSFSKNVRKQYGIILARFDDTWTGYLWGTAVVGAIGAVVTTLLMMLLGIPNPVGIAALTTIVLLIPLFGPALGTVVCFIAALIGGSSVLNLSSVQVAVITGIAFFFVRGFLIGNFVYPRIVGKSVDVPAVIVMIGLAFFGSIGGILGMLLSPVLVALLRDLMIFVLRKLDRKEPFPDAPMPEFMNRDYLTHQPIEP